MPWRANDYEELIKRDKASLDIFWLRDESLNESDNLPYLDVLRQEILEDFEAALELFREIPTVLDGEATKETTDVAVRFAESELFQHWRGRYNEDVNGGLYPNVLPDRLCLSDE